MRDLPSQAEWIRDILSGAIRPICGGLGADEESDGGAETSTATPFEFELDLESDAEVSAASSAPAEGAADALGAPRPSAAPASPSPAEIPPQVQTALNALARQQAEVREMLDPVLRGQRARTLADATTPPVTEEFLKTDPNATIADLFKHLDWKQQRALDDLRGTATAAARRATSENTARGVLSAAALGEGRDYDTFRAKYVEPLYAQNPATRQLIDAVAGQDGDPARIEYLVAFTNYVSERVGNDPVKAFKLMLSALDAPANAVEDVAGKIREAQDRGAAKIARASAPGAQRKKLDATAIWNLSDEQFEQLPGVV